MIKIGEFANLFNVTIKTVRLYEEKNLIIPYLVDRYTGYRYYDEKNIEEMTKILILKDLGLSLKEIGTFHFDSVQIQSKIHEYEKQVEKINNSIKSLKSLSQNKEGILDMKIFINDQDVVGKWRLVGVTDTVENAKSSIFIEDDFNIKELFLLPNGEEYWVISWTKGIVYLKGMECEYILDKDKMYLQIPDPYDTSFSKIAIYENVDRKEYSIDEIGIKDDTNLEFISDPNLIGCFKSVDFVSKKELFDPKVKRWNYELFLDKIMVSNDGDCIVIYNAEEKITKQIKYTKEYFINLAQPDTASKYEYLEIDNETYIIVEWKSGDYVYGNMINGYYVLKKEN